MAGPGRLGGGDGEHADRPAAVDEHAAAADVAGAPDGVDGDAEGLGDRALLGRDALGERAQLVGADHPAGAEAALLVRLEGGRPEVADLGPQVGAGQELLGHLVVADERGRVDGDGGADLDALDLGADLRDRAGDLVAQDEGVLEDGVVETPLRT